MGDRGPFAKEFRVANDIEIGSDFVAAPDGIRDFFAGFNRDGAFVHNYAVFSKDLRNFPCHLFDVSLSFERPTFFVRIAVMVVQAGIISDRRLSGTDPAEMGVKLCRTLVGVLCCNAIPDGSGKFDPRAAGKQR
jgi:hypothetical protein